MPQRARHVLSPGALMPCHIACLTACSAPCLTCCRITVLYSAPRQLDSVMSSKLTAGDPAMLASRARRDHTHMCTCCCAARCAGAGSGCGERDMPGVLAALMGVHDLARGSGDHLPVNLEPAHFGQKA